MPKLGRARQRRRFPARPEHGAAAVEFALILPILAMLLLGIVTAGIGFGTAIGVANAVREGARFAATSIPTTASPAPYTTAQWTAWADNVNTRTRTLMTDSTSGQATVCTQIWKNTTAAAGVPTEQLSTPRCDVGSQGVAGGASPTPPSIDSQTCAVTVWATRQVRVNALLISVNPTIRRDSIARYERTC